MKNILILDTGKEWGGGTNSLLELLRRIDKKNYKFTALFYHNYSKPNETFMSFKNTMDNKNNPPSPPFVKGGMGGFSGEFDIKTEIEKLDVNFILMKHSRWSLSAKILKETGRTLLFFSERLRKLYVFFIEYFFRIEEDAARIARLLKDLNIDILYMNNQPSTNIEGILAAKTAGIKSLLHSRIETELNFFEVKAVNKWLTKMICVSGGVRESFIRQGVDFSKCITVYNGIDAGTTPAIPPHEIRRELGIKEEEFVIGSAGSLVRRKRFDDLIKALGYLKAQNMTTSPLSSAKSPHPPFVKGGQGGIFNKIKCVIIGDGPEREALKKLIEKTGLDDTVILAGFKSDAISYINAMDIFVLSSEREGFSRVILEAMLMGKAVVATNIAGPSELVVDNETGFLYKAGDVKGLSERLSKLASSLALRKDFGKAGRKRAIENFSIEKYVSRVSSIIAEAAG